MSAGASIAPEAIGGEAEESLTLEVDPSVIVLGETREAVLTLSTSGDSGDKPLQGSVNVGTLGEIEEIEPGLHRIVYTPPDRRFPQTAIVALWRDTGPDAPLFFFRLPLVGTARVPIQTRSGASVTVEVEGESFGPFEADRAGRVEARLKVPPGVRLGTVTAVGTDGQATSQKLDLGSPPFNRLTLAAVPSAVPADGVSEARIHLFHDSHGVGEVSADRIRIKASEGLVSEILHRGGPLYQASFTAPLGMTPGEVSLGASVQNDRASTASVSLRVMPQSIADIAVAASVSQLVADGMSSAKLAVSVTDGLGIGIEGLDIEAIVQPEHLDAETRLEEIGGGEYSVEVLPARFDPPADAKQALIRVRAGEEFGQAELLVLPWEVASIRVEPELIRLTAQGRSAAMIRVRAFDSHDRPLDHLLPRLEASAGTIGSSERAEEGGYVARYLSPVWSYRVRATGRASPPVRDETIRIVVGNKEAEAVVRLTAGVREAWIPKTFLELGGGYRSNIDHLAGAQGSLHAGVHLISERRFSLGGGFWLGPSLQRGEWEVVGFGEDDGWAEATLMSVPILATCSGQFRPDPWGIGFEGGAGLMMVPGQLELARGEDVSVDGVLPAWGARLWIGRYAGAGHLTLAITYVHALQERGRDRPDVTGQLGGFGGSLGYRIER